MDTVETSGMDQKPLGLRISRTSILLLASFVIFLAMFWISMELWTAPVAVVWHATHGNSVSIVGRDVPIPWDMWVSRSDGDGFTIVRDAPNNDALRSPSGILLIETTGQTIDFSKDYDRLSRVNLLPRAGFQKATVREFAGTGTKGYCWEAITLNSAYAAISCWFDKSTVSASFVGSAGYRDKIYRVAEALAGAPKH